MNIFSGNELDPTDQPDAALIFGGDGTMHRHLGSLAGRNIPLLMVPLGSANDFASTLGIASIEQSLAAWRRFCSSADNTRAIDLGTIRPLNDDDEDDGKATPSISTQLSPDSADPAVGPRLIPLDDSSPWQGESLETLHFVPSGPRRDLPELGPRIMQSQLRRMPETAHDAGSLTYFACIAGTGLDAAVNRLTLNQPRWLRGHGGYAIALVQVLGAFQPPQITVSIEVEGRWQTRVNEPGFLVAAGNGPQYGHGMRLTHQAVLDDGLLDVCFVRQLSKLRLLRLFRLVYRGAHIGMKEVEYFRATRLRLHTSPLTEVFGDGEYICRTPVEIGLRPGALRVIVGPASH